MLAVAAWIGWSIVHPHAGSGAAWPVILLDDFLAAVFLGGLVGSVIGLLAPRRLGVIFAIAVFGLVQVLLHPEEGAVHPSQAPLVTAVLLFLGFGGGSVAFNRYFAWRGRPTRLVAAEAQ